MVSNLGSFGMLCLTNKLEIFFWNVSFFSSKICFYGCTLHVVPFHFDHSKDLNTPLVQSSVSSYGLYFRSRFKSREITALNAWVLFLTSLTFFNKLSLSEFGWSFYLNSVWLDLRPIFFLPVVDRCLHKGILWMSFFKTFRISLGIMYWRISASFLFNNFKNIFFRDWFFHFFFHNRQHSLGNMICSTCNQCRFLSWLLLL